MESGQGRACGPIFAWARVPRGKGSHNLFLISIELLLFGALLNVLELGLNGWIVYLAGARARRMEDAPRQEDSRYTRDERSPAALTRRDDRVPCQCWLTQSAMSSMTVPDTWPSEA
jgi:hypothetical protein